MFAPRLRKPSGVSGPQFFKPAPWFLPAPGTNVLQAAIFPPILEGSLLELRQAEASASADNGLPASRRSLSPTTLDNESPQIPAPPSQVMGKGDLDSPMLK